MNPLNIYTLGEFIETPPESFVVSRGGSSGEMSCDNCLGEKSSPLIFQLFWNVGSLYCGSWLIMKS